MADQNSDRSQAAHVGYLRTCACKACEANPLRLLERAAKRLVLEYDEGNVDIDHDDGCPGDDTCACPQVEAFNDIARVVLRNEGYRDG